METLARRGTCPAPRRLARAALPFAFVLAGVASPRTAAAQIPNALYDDVKSIIGDLMTQEIAQSVVPNVTCSAPPGLLVHYPLTLQRIYDRQFGSLKSTLQAETAELAGSYVYYVLATKDANTDLRWFFNGYQWPTSFDAKTCPSAIRTANGPYYYGSSAQMETSLLATKCDGNSLDPSKLDQSVACALGYATREFLLGHVEVGEERLRKALVAFIALRYQAARAGTSATTADLEIIDDWLTSVLRPGMTPPELPALLAKFVAEVDKEISALKREWRLATNGGLRHVDPLVFIDSLLSSASMAASLCSAAPLATSNLCLSVSRAKAALRGTSTLSMVMTASVRNDARAIAVGALQAAFTTLKGRDDCKSQSNESDKDGHEVTALTAQVKAAKENAMNPARATDAEAPQCEQLTVISRYGTFIASLAAYTIEAETAGRATEASKEAFRSATFDLLRSEGPATGFDQRWWTNVILPKPSLDFSWSPGFINQSTSDGFRYVARLRELSLRKQLKYREWSYVAMELSLIDVLGPVSEAGLRNQSTYRNPELVYAMLFDPSLQIVFGFPSLSTHLALTGGVSYRGAAAFREADGSLAYHSPFQRPKAYDDQRSSYYLQFFATSVGITYVP